MNRSTRLRPKSTDNRIVNGEPFRGASISGATNPFCTRFVRPGTIQFRFVESEFENDSIHNPISQLCDVIASNHRSLIVGPHGTGQSTLVQSLLRQLVHDFETVTHIQLCMETPTRFESPFTWFTHWRNHCVELASNRKTVLSLLHQMSSTKGLLVIDGIEQLSSYACRQLICDARRLGVRVLATSHRSKRLFETIYQTSLSERMIRELTANRIVDAPEGIKAIVQQELERQDLNEIRNLRDFWFMLYDVVAVKSHSEVI